MTGWKKIVVVLGLSGAAGLLGAACSTETAETETEEATDAVATMDTPGEAPAEVVSVGRPGFGGPGFARRCSDRCRGDYVQCGRGRGFSSNPLERERRCRNRLNGCLLSCPRF
jgi:hypothetical protein